MHAAIDFGEGVDRTGIVVIGRNEGVRLAECLRSCIGTGCCVIYVDSGSDDGSVALARELGADVVELDGSSPFTAARARNGGFDRLRKVCPQADAVQFVDGDCELTIGWLAAARTVLDGMAKAGIVCGRLLEKYPDASVYNRVCQVEWDKPAGLTDSCGGIFMVRANLFQEAGGFDSTIAAGEEPELCTRLVRRGWQVVRIDNPMAVHDANMLRCKQWWERQVRAGYGTLNVVKRCGFQRFQREVWSTRFWSLGLPFAVVAVLIVGTTIHNVALGAVLALIVALVLPAQMLRVAVRKRHDGYSLYTASAYGVLVIVGKWGQLVGQCRFIRDQWRGEVPN